MDVFAGLMSHLVRDRETGEWRFFGLKNSTACHLAQLRHAYALLKGGYVKDLSQFADGLIAPAYPLPGAVRLN